MVAIGPRRTPRYDGPPHLAEAQICFTEIQSIYACVLCVVALFGHARCVLDHKPHVSEACNDLLAQPQRRAPNEGREPLCPFEVGEPS